LPNLYFNKTCKKQVRKSPDQALIELVMEIKKIRLRYTFGEKGKPGPRGPSNEPIQIIVEMKQRNPRYGCPKIAEKISKLFGIDINKGVVRRILDIDEIKSISYTPCLHPLH